jgi:hypothetical protein
VSILCGPVCGPANLDQHPPSRPYIPKRRPSSPGGTPGRKYTFVERAQLRGAQPNPRVRSVRTTSFVQEANLYAKERLVAKQARKQNRLSLSQSRRPSTATRTHSSLPSRRPSNQTVRSTSYSTTAPPSSTLAGPLADRQDDRNDQGYEAREALIRPRTPHIGEDSQSDPAPHGGQGKRGLLGKHKSKSARRVVPISLTFSSAYPCRCQSYLSMCHSVHLPFPPSRADACTQRTQERSTAQPDTST